MNRPSTPAGRTVNLDEVPSTTSPPQHIHERLLGRLCALGLVAAASATSGAIGLPAIRRSERSIQSDEDEASTVDSRMERTRSALRIVGKLRALGDYVHEPGYANPMRETVAAGLKGGAIPFISALELVVASMLERTNDDASVALLTALAEEGRERHRDEVSRLVMHALAYESPRLWDTVALLMSPDEIGDRRYLPELEDAANRVRWPLVKEEFDRTIEELKTSSRNV